MNKVLVTLGALTLAFAAWVVMSEPAPKSAYAAGGDAIDDAGDAVGRWGTKQRTGSVADRVSAKVQQVGAQLTGNPELANRADANEAAGVLGETAGKFAQAAGQTIKDLNL